MEFERFKAKARHFLREQPETIALQKLRRGQPLSEADLQSLQQMLIDAGIGNEMTIEAATQAADGLGRFVRSLVGLERDEVERAFSDFLAEGSASADQIEFVTLVIDHLTERGVMDPALLYESPFTDLAPQGPDQVFDMPRTERLFSIIETFNRSAAA